jgi:hypothetical protein
LEEEVVEGLERPAKFPEMTVTEETFGIVEIGLAK